MRRQLEAAVTEEQTKKACPLYPSNAAEEFKREAICCCHPDSWNSDVID